jgi:hypothetical protein
MHRIAIAMSVVALGMLACSSDADPGGDPSSGGSSNVGGTGASAGGGGSGQGGTATGTGGAGGQPPTGKVPMFMAQGHMGMTVVSCDDGQSWVGYRTFETEASPLLCGDTTVVQCFSGACSYLDGNGDCQQVASDCDCDHSPGSGKGLAFGDGAFVATFGWGQPGVVMRSTNGFDWDVVDTGNTFADVVAGNGYIALSARSPMFSTDGGLTYTEGTDAQHNPWNVRRLFYFPGSDRFMQTAASGDNRDLRLTSDWMSWTEPATLPGGCESVSQAVEANGVVVTSANADYLCWSSDGGDNFSRVDLPGAPNLFSGPVWDGAQFIVWGMGNGHSAYTSADGQAWTEQATNLSGQDRFGEVARDPTSGTMVAARAQWQAWYGEMRWYRSSDGITWETLSPQASILSHPVRELTFGYADPSGLCPAP